MFRLLIAALAAALLLSFAPPAHSQELPPLLGDVDCAGDVSTVDAALILQFDTGLIDSPRCLDGGDVNDDGNVDTIDASIILQLVRGLIDGMPPVSPDPLPPPASGEVVIGSAEAGPGQHRVVALEARGIAAPGLGAWAIEVEYNPAVVSLHDPAPEIGGRSCDNESGLVLVCNPDFASGVLRLSGANAHGLEGDTELASLTFQCGDVEGVSDLTLNLRVFADATVGAPQPINPTVTHGSITCGETARLQLTVFVIHDLNGNGQRDPGEPGVEGWSVELPGFCGGDIAFQPAGPSATDADGRVEFAVKEPWGCIRAEDKFGWVFTTVRPLVTSVGPRQTEALILVRKVGQQLHLLRGAVLIDGLPAPEGTSIDAVVDNASCGDSEIVVPFGTNYEARYTMYVLGELDRPGCASEGDLVEITVDGGAVADVTFASGSTGELHLYLGPTPMWFIEGPREGPAPVPYIGSLICGEARTRPSGFTPTSSHNVYVFPDALRSGCGAPGRIVTLRVGDEVLRQVVWQEGFVPFDELQDVVLPRVGAFAQPSGSGFSLTASGARLYAIALALAGLGLVSGGAVIWRRRRAG
ncbi:MAG: hypothetical protein IIC91_12105 [Chloroflexi bacterium]|nr:hypothetical protein [Chloroflexota bacterium]